LEGVATVSLEATATARAIVELRENHRHTIINSFGRAAGNGLRVLESLYKTPFTTTGSVQKLLKITFPPASNLIQRMVDADMLVEVTGQDRYRIYQYRPYVSLFSDPVQTGGVARPTELAEG
jgi:hypothetical protein